ncbi:glycoprotease family-domain-containing protein [Phlebopus sp. FC_14]|nr:glycoprotease family-domain-containing protein [Phlebopus sp. FC_14]
MLASSIRCCRLYRIASLRAPGRLVGFYEHPSQCRPFTVLAIESSADDTCAAVVSSSHEILSNVIIKQHEIHKTHGGIHPFRAIQSHQQNMPIAVRRALDEANVTMEDIDGVAFTRGPGASQGMSGCLSVGSNAAKTLAAALNKPLVGVHHMQAHALTALFTTPSDQLPKFPFLSLLISGGHTLLVLVSSKTSFKLIAESADESIGCAYDKVSRLLELPWGDKGPGAALEQFCLKKVDELPEIRPFAVPVPRQLVFSFSGLHSIVDKCIREFPQPLSESHKVALARAFQTSAAEQLCSKLKLCFETLAGQKIFPKDVVVSGGVASNLFLRQSLKQALDKYSGSTPSDRINFFFPPPHLCTDNAVMIAWASLHRFLARDYDDYSVELQAKWNIDAAPVATDPSDATTVQTPLE